MAADYLVVTAVGEDRPGIVAELTGRLADLDVNVADSRMAVLGGEFALVLLLALPDERAWEAREEIEEVAARLGLQTIIRETRSPADHRAGNVRSYDVDVHALDHPGIVHAVTAALRGLGGNVISLETSAYQAAMTGAPLFRMKLCADFPPDVSATRLRRVLSEVSEASNADIEVRPRE